MGMLAVLRWSGHRRHDHPGPDNGVKLVDPAGEMLEAVATSLANCDDTEVSG